MALVKKTLIRIAIAFAVCGALEILNKIQYLSFFDKLFVFALIYLVLGGFTFIRANGFFAFQKYAFKKVASKMPFVSRLLMNAGNATEPLEENRADKNSSEDDNDKLKSYHDFKESETDTIDQSEAYPSLLSAVLIGLFCTILSII